jgi:hypothetical protein
MLRISTTLTRLDRVYKSLRVAWLDLSRLASLQATFNTFNDVSDFAASHSPDDVRGAGLLVTWTIAGYRYVPADMM